jgi:hypothetical protein
MSATNKRPDWAYWANMAEVRLWQAVALSLDIEPRWLSSNGEPPSKVPGLVFDRRPPGYVERLQVAGSHLPSLETSPTWGGRDGAPVRLAIVRRWGESLPFPWTFPSGFPGAEGEGIKRQPGAGEPLTPVEPAAPVVSGARVNSTKGRRPPNLLRPAVDEARRRCQDPNDAAEVWGWLESLAEGKEPPPPLIECTKSGIKWRKGSEDATLTREMLGKRLNRDPWPPPPAAPRR